MVEGVHSDDGVGADGQPAASSNARPPLSGAKEGGTGAVLWFTCTQSKTAFRIGSGRREGGDSIPGLALGISCTLRFRRRAGLSDPSSAWWAVAPALRDGPRPASYYMSASHLAASRDTRPIAIPIWDGVAYLLSFMYLAKSSTFCIQPMSWFCSSGMPDKSYFFHFLVSISATIR